MTFKQGPEQSERTSHLKIRKETFQAEEQPENQWGWGVVGEEEGGRIRLERQAGARVQWGLVATVASSGFSLSEVRSSDTHEGASVGRQLRACTPHGSGPSSAIS